jgi:hypothetical protein
MAAVVFATLPTHAETVAWISGRADSVPALFYLSTLATYAAWRRLGVPALYAGSVGLFLLALFSKQYAITMLVTLLLYDVLVEGVRLRASWSLVRAYAPFAVLTLAYLILRYALFGHFVREGTAPAEGLVRSALRVQSLNLEVLIFGAPVLEDFPTLLRVPLRALGTASVVLGAVLSGYLVLRRPAVSSARRIGGVLVFFGPAWWIVSVAPLSVTYATPRHLYLPTAGLVIALAALAEALARAARKRSTTIASTATGAAFAAACLIGLQPRVDDWNHSATLSQKMIDDVQLAAAAAPVGTLLVLGAPRRAFIEQRAPPAASSQVIPPPGEPWLWSWAIPFALDPPFTPLAISQRVAVVAPLAVYCCLPQQWFAATRDTIAAWAAASDRPPVIVLAWDRSSGALAEQSDTRDPCLRGSLLRVAEVDSAEEMDRLLGAILSRVKGGQAACP